jgi:hypothetical protein
MFVPIPILLFLFVVEDNVLELVILDLLIAITTNFLMDVKSTLKLM